MTFGQAFFLAFLLIVATILIAKRGRKKTIIDERGSPQMRVDAAKAAAAAAEQARKDARGGS